MLDEDMPYQCQIMWAIVKKYNKRKSVNQTRLVEEMSKEIVWLQERRRDELNLFMKEIEKCDKRIFKNLKGYYSDTQAELF